MKTSLQKNSTPIHPIQHSSSSIQSVPSLIAMTTRALSLGSVCIQSEWDFCKDSSGLHLFCLPHQSSIHTEMTGTKRKTPWHQKWEYRVGFLRVGKRQIAKRWNTHSKSKKDGAWKLPLSAEIMWNVILYGKHRVWIHGKYQWHWRRFTFQKEDSGWTYIQSSKHIWIGFRRWVLLTFRNYSTLLFQLINLW